MVILKEPYDVLAFYFMYIYILAMNSRVSVVSIMYDSDFEYRQGQEIFLFFKSPRSALRSTQLPIQWVPVAHSLRVKW